MGTVIFSGVFFAFVAYCEVLGYGFRGSRLWPTHRHRWMIWRCATPLRELAIGLDFAAAVSCFSGLLGGIAASGRMLFALGRAGLSSVWPIVHPTHGTPGGRGFVGRASDHCPVCAVGAVCQCRRLLQLHQHDWRTGIDTGLHRRRRRRTDRSPTRAATTVVDPLHFLAAAAAVGAVSEHLSGAVYPNNLWPYFALAWMLIAWG
jgi:hypothetical protein